MENKRKKKKIQHIYISHSDLSSLPTIPLHSTRAASLNTMPEQSKTMCSFKWRCLAASTTYEKQENHYNISGTQEFWKKNKKETCVKKKKKKSWKIRYSSYHVQGNFPIIQMLKRNSEGLLNFEIGSQTT